MNTNTATSTPTNTTWLTEQIESRGLARVEVQEKAHERPSELDKRRTRYGVVPTRSHIPAKSQEFLAWEIPANTIFPFRYFLSETVRDFNNNVLDEVYRQTDHQIEDMFRIIPTFVELPELFYLEEDAADRIAQVIHLPRKCTKYPSELGTACTTCWLAYLEHDVANRIDDELEGEERSAAYSVARKIITGLENSLANCRKQLDAALRDIDDPRSGKKQFNENDLETLYHLHNDRPQYKTSVDRESTLSDTLAQAFEKLTQALTPRQELPQDTAAIGAQLAEMQKRLEEAEKAEKREAQPVEPPKEIDEDEYRAKQRENLAKAREAKKLKQDEESAE